MNNGKKTCIDCKEFRAFSSNTCRAGICSNPACGKIQIKHVTNRDKIKEVDVAWLLKKLELGCPPKDFECESLDPKEEYCRKCWEKWLDEEAEE